MAAGEGVAAMKCVLFALVPVFVLFVTAGCDPTNLPSDAKAILTAQGINPDAAGDQLQAQQNPRLRDGSCAGDANQNQYGGAGGGNGANGAGGQGNGERLRLRDGSCGDGNGG
jgi:hypothetical protein